MSDHFQLWAPWIIGYGCVGLVCAAWRKYQEIVIVDRYGVAKEYLFFAISDDRTTKWRLRRYKILRALEAGFSEEATGTGILVLLFPILTINACIGIATYAILFGAIHGWLGAAVVCVEKSAKDNNILLPDIKERLTHVYMPMFLGAIQGLLAVGFQSLLIPITLHVAWDVFCLTVNERDLAKSTR